MMLWYNWALTLIAIAASVLAFSVSMLFGNKASEKENLVSEKNDISLRTIKEIIEGFPVIKAFKTEKQIVRLYDRSNNDLENAKYSKRMLLTLVNIISQFTHNLDEALLKKYDEVIVMKDGKLIERGSFDELLEADGYFRSFYRITGTLVSKNLENI